MKTSTRIRIAPLMLALLSACTVIHPPPMQMPARDNIVPGETLVVDGSQNIYAFSRAHNVSMRDVIVLNNLQAPFILHRGQSITLPASSPTNLVSSASDARAPQSASTSGVEQSALAPVDQASMGTPKATSLSSNSSSVASTPLSPSSNAIVPGPVTSEPMAAPPTKAPTVVDTLNQPSPTPKVVATTATPSTMGNSETTVAALPPSTPLKNDSAANANLGDAPTFVWPVQGPILSSFGSKGQGLNNDGINIGAPKGSPVVAASSGTVVYAGSEMKGFGNLILIRHPGGYITAYAHLDRILVNKDTVVASGDMIGTLGKSGDVPSPQLHFEIRHNSKPVDPATLITSSSN